MLQLSREDHYTSEVQDAIFTLKEAVGIPEERLEAIYKENFGRVGAYDGEHTPL